MKKVHINMCPIFGQLRSYDRFLIPVHALVWTASTAGEVMDSA